MKQKFDPDQPAILHYGDGDYAIVKQGAFVVCAVSGRKIPLEALRYWNATHQEAYAGAREATQRWIELNGDLKKPPQGEQI